jgi:hypothetical protein
VNHASAPPAREVGFGGGAGPGCSIIIIIRDRTGSRVVVDPEQEDEIACARHGILKHPAPPCPAHVFHPSKSYANNPLNEKGDDKVLTS